MEGLARLSVVPVRDVWSHEARDFTPWLLENVDVLSDLLQMELELEVAEHAVGDFRLDLLGRDTASGELVIVENQLEQSDHTHLGQILTYAAGTGPATIIWVASRFRDEHRAALDWLNERTNERTRFFGVEIEVVRIADSLPAPAFKLVVQPNEWEKQVKATSAETGLTERARLYWDFWDRTRVRIQAENPAWSRSRTSTKDSWFTMAVGTSGVTLAMTFSRQGLGVQLNFEGPDANLNNARFEEMRSRAEEFEQAFDGEVRWEPLPGNKSARIAVYHSVFNTVTDMQRWDDMIDWLVDQIGRFHRAIAAVGGIPTVPTE